MNKQKGRALLLIVILIALVVGGYLVYQKQTKPASLSQPTVQPSPTSVVSPAPTGADKASPDESYVVSETQIGDYNTIAIKDKQGKMLVDDLVSQNSKEIGYNVKFKCMCATYFKSWVSNEKFSIQVVNGGGEEYEYLVDAKTGKVDESSFKRIK